MKPGTIARIEVWPFWEAEHPVLVAQYRKSNDTHLLLPISHSHEFCSLCLPLDDSEIPSAYGHVGPLDMRDGKSYLFMREKLEGRQTGNSGQWVTIEHSRGIYTAQFVTGEPAIRLHRIAQLTPDEWIPLREKIRNLGPYA